jgi:tau tubulin kinase
MYSFRYIHRDIKPSNFVRGARAGGGGGGGGGNKHRRFYLIDLGMSRGYLDKEGNVRKARLKCEFRGTSKYASLNSHEHKDLGRRDDLWSFCFATLQVRERESYLYICFYNHSFVF